MSGNSSPISLIGKITETVSVGPLTKTFSSKGFFFENNPDVKMRIWGVFKTHILPFSCECEVSEKPSTILDFHDLIKEEGDGEIRARLSKDHVFAIDDLWMIANLLSRQPKGENGDLKNDGCANLFYVQAGIFTLAVSVRWSGVEWSVFAWFLGRGGCWDEGSRVFSRHS